jgi:hypothetical protein
LQNPAPLCTRGPLMGGGTPPYKKNVGGGALDAPEEDFRQGQRAVGGDSPYERIGARGEVGVLAVGNA